MELETLQIFQQIGWAGVAGIFIWKVLAPLMTLFIQKIGGNNDGKLSKRVSEIENNHLEAIRNDMAELKQDMREVKIEQGKMRERIMRLETKIFNTK